MVVSESRLKTTETRFLGTTLSEVVRWWMDVRSDSSTSEALESHGDAVLGADTLSGGAMVDGLGIRWQHVKIAWVS